MEAATYVRLQPFARLLPELFENVIKYFPLFLQQLSNYWVPSCYSAYISFCPPSTRIYVVFYWYRIICNTGKPCLQLLEERFRLYLVTFENSLYYLPHIPKKKWRQKNLYDVVPHTREGKSSKAGRTWGVMRNHVCGRPRRGQDKGRSHPHAE